MQNSNVMGLKFKCVIFDIMTLTLKCVIMSSLLLPHSRTGLQSYVFVFFMVTVGVGQEWAQNTDGSP